MNPLLSVIIPCYNGEKYLAATLNSVLDQIREGIEIVIVDDGSTDRTVEIATEFAEKLPIRLITPGRMGSAEIVTNIGLHEAKGEWATILHCDDYWLPGRIARLWNEMANANGELIIHNTKYVGPAGQKLGFLTCPFTDGNIPSDLFIERLLVQNSIAPPSVVFRRKTAIETGCMDLKIFKCPDWDLWLRLGALGSVRFIAEPLCAYRIHGGASTVDTKRPIEETMNQLRVVLARHLESWTRTGRSREAVERAAWASIEVNTALYFSFRKWPTRPHAVILELFALGPLVLYRYLRDSRILQRLSARLKVQRLLRST